jgi:hypothetical protein
MNKDLASSMPGGYAWQIDDSNWVGVGFRQDGTIILYTDEGICEHDSGVMGDFFFETSLADDRIVPNGGPLPDDKPSKIIPWNLGAGSGQSTVSEDSASVVNVAIKHVQYDGAGRTEADEYVEIANQGEAAVDLSGWQLQSEGTNQVFTFPEGAVIDAGQSVRVYTNQVNVATGGFSFGSGRAVWNNRGDIAQLIDAQGKVQSRYAYGNKATA